jgi:hypothetical protein
MLILQQYSCQRGAPSKYVMRPRVSPLRLKHSPHEFERKGNKLEYTVTGRFHLDGCMLQLHVPSFIASLHIPSTGGPTTGHRTCCITHQHHLHNHNSNLRNLPARPGAYICRRHDTLTLAIDYHIHAHINSSTRGSRIGCRHPQKQKSPRNGKNEH